MAKVTAIHISEKKGMPVRAVSTGICRENWGFEGDSHAGSGIRQVSLFGMKSIRKMEMPGMEGLCTGRFTENITTEGIALYELPVGTHISIGCCELEVTQIGKACHLECAVFRQKGDCVMPREVIFARIIKGGRISTGDEVIRLPLQE